MLHACACVFVCRCITNKIYARFKICLFNLFCSVVVLTRIHLSFFPPIQPAIGARCLTFLSKFSSKDVRRRKKNDIFPMRNNYVSNYVSMALISFSILLYSNYIERLPTNATIQRIALLFNFETNHLNIVSFRPWFAINWFFFICFLFFFFFFSKWTSTPQK